MRSLLFLILISLFSYVLSKNVKTLSENMGQEVIEIAGPKELPPGFEEEPAGDLDDEDDDDKSTTKRDAKRSSTGPDGRKKVKDVEKIDGTSPEDEEARLEKELAEIYKDTDYKDSADAEDTIEPKESSTTTETIGDTSVDVTEKPIGRQRNNFKFAPDTTNKKDVEKFRTSLDDISCKGKQMLNAMQTATPYHKNMMPGSAPQRVFSQSVLHISLLLILKIWI